MEIFLKDMSINGSTQKSVAINQISALSDLTEDFSHYLCMTLETESTQFKDLSLLNVSDIFVSKVLYRENLFSLDFLYIDEKSNEYEISLDFLLPSFIEDDDDYKEICTQVEESFENELLISSWIRDDEILLNPTVEWSHEYECEDDHDSSIRYHESSENWSMNSLIYELLVSQGDDLERSEVDFFQCEDFLNNHVYVIIEYGCIHFYVYDFNYESLENEHSFRLSLDNEQEYLEVIKRYFSKYLLD